MQEFIQGRFDEIKRRIVEQQHNRLPSFRVFFYESNHPEWSHPVISAELFLENIKTPDSVINSIIELFGSRHTLPAGYHFLVERLMLAPCGIRYYRIPPIDNHYDHTNFDDDCISAVKHSMWAPNEYMFVRMLPGKCSNHAIYGEEGYNIKSYAKISVDSTKIVFRVQHGLEYTEEAKVRCR